MHTTASSLVVIAQYFWRIRTSLFFVYQQKFNIEAVNDYPPIRFEIRFERKFPIRRSLVRSLGLYRDVSSSIGRVYLMSTSYSSSFIVSFFVQF